MPSAASTNSRLVGSSAAGPPDAARVACRRTPRRARSARWSARCRTPRLGRGSARMPSPRRRRRSRPKAAAARAGARKWGLLRATHARRKTSDFFAWAFSKRWAGSSERAVCARRPAGARGSGGASPGGGARPRSCARGARARSGADRRGLRRHGAARCGGLAGHGVLRGDDHGRTRGTYPAVATLHGPTAAPQHARQRGARRPRARPFPDTCCAPKASAAPLRCLEMRRFSQTLPLEPFCAAPQAQVPRPAPPAGDVCAQRGGAVVRDRPHPLHPPRVLVLHPPGLPLQLPSLPLLEIR
jgi:hypothetical protein